MSFNQEMENAPFLETKSLIITFAENLNHKYEIASLPCSGILCGDLRCPGRGSTWTPACCQIRTTSDHPETWKPGGTGCVKRCKICERHTDSIAGKTH
ncbi:hypothetical protein CEXT_180561 [Caerostris extrusa]|uniref:Uncharacterized protein n=1 Tax=Caerostris extrusa TaxID=172846 RepID=A0AAV4XKE7_CAEEX|nr:hypothetical protein CEXT_180561 [Caerostris extrusa]